MKITLVVFFIHDSVQCVCEVCTVQRYHVYSEIPCLKITGVTVLCLVLVRSSTVCDFNVFYNLLCGCAKIKYCLKQFTSLTVSFCVCVCVCRYKKGNGTENKIADFLITYCTQGLFNSRTLNQNEGKHWMLFIRNI